jgi:tRNA nucleotidyltransferase (CCA-adding enzyme)
MHVILTHEQADFDAVAAELGAYLLNEHALPVLPRRLNRNVRAFLTIYGADLPFVEPRDLPQGSIRAVTLVDTQSMITLKGMGHDTKVHVIDHHQIRPDFPQKWTMTHERVGACTTLLVEALHEHNGPLTSSQASLLLLGIYEDTGSLTYVSTTVRDVRAVAYLLEAGANMHILAEYLNPPLSEEQLRLYDRLLSSAEPHPIHGQNVIIAQANGEDLKDEISSVAHKLRDLLDPDALLLLVSTSDGVRLVARSTTDQVDVSAIAAHFGGGGHERAAAALIKADSSAGGMQQAPVLDRIYRELLEILPNFTRPSITVDRIMSQRPQLLTPETPARDAAQLMQRYGYEGYPVIAGGKVIGLLTRRAVDRALAHNLNLPAGSLMEAGEITIHPGDAIEDLQRVMANTGWGQVPVVDPETGAVIGIVTRTDLLKNLSSGTANTPGKLNLASRLIAVLPPAKVAFLRLIGEQAHQMHMAVYIVGGFVRDILLDHPSNDFDIVVEGDATALTRALTARFDGHMVSHSRFGTAKWQIQDIREQLIKHSPVFPPDANPNDLPVSLDLISARTEFYDYPTALPTVERSSIKLDLHRRDFTINTMALRLDGHHYGDLYDYWGGLSDLRQGLVRVLHSLSFVDDPTRLLRAVRFEQRFNFKIETRTRELMEGAKELIRQVSGDRLRHEINLIFCEEHAAEMLARLHELDLLEAIQPGLLWKNELAVPLREALLGEIDPTWDLPERIGNISIRQFLGYLVWLTENPMDVIRNTAERLRFPRMIRAAVEESSILWKELPGLRGASPSVITQRLDSVPLPTLYGIYILQPSKEIKQILEDYVHSYRHVKSYTTGQELKEMNVPPGPAYRNILEQLRSAWLDGKITSSIEEKGLLQDLLHALQESK